jgi:uncharacterized repeat protein (TIGR01451 family)
MIGRWHHWLFRRTLICKNRCQQRQIRPHLEVLEERVTPVLFGMADLQLLSVTHTPSLAVAGQPETFRTTVRNNGPNAVTGVSLHQTFNQTLTGLKFTPSVGTYSPTTGNWTGFNLAAGASITLTATGAPSTTATGVLSTTATVGALSGTYDTNPSNNTKTDSVSITQGFTADLGITATDSTSDGTLAVGSSVTFTVVVTNESNLSVFDVKVTDSLPADFMGAHWMVSSTSGTGTSAAASSGTGGINTTVSMGPNGKITFKLTATLKASVSPGTTETYLAFVTPPYFISDPDYNDNTSQDNVTARA